MISKEIEMPVLEFRKWFEKETNPLVKPLDKEANALINNVKKKIKEVQEACEKLIKESERDMEKGKAYHRSRVAKKLAQLFIDTLNKTTFPEQASFKNTEDLLKDLKKALSTIERERNIWFPRISPLFIMARRKIDVVLSKLFDSIEKLDLFSSEKYVKAKSVADCFAVAGNIVELLDDLEKIEEEKKEVESTISSVNKEIEEAKQKILSLQQKDEMKELLKINNQVKELTRKVRHELRYLQKPFIKLQNLYNSGIVNIPAEEAQKLSEYLTRPFATLSTEEPGHPLLKKLLHKVNESMEHEKLKIKSSRQRKAQDQIETILEKNTLESLQQLCKQAYERRRQLSTASKIATFKNEISTQEMTIKELERQMEHLHSKFLTRQNSIKEKKDRLEALKEELEKTVAEITAKNIRLTVQVF